MNKDYKMSENERKILEDLQNDITKAFKEIKEFNEPLGHMFNLVSNMRITFGNNFISSELTTELDFLSFLQQLKIQNTKMKKSRFGYYDIGDKIEPLMKEVEKRIKKKEEELKGIPELLVPQGEDKYLVRILPPPKKRGRPKKQ